MQVAGVQTKRWPRAQQILPRPFRSVSSAAPETIRFSHRDRTPLQPSRQKPKEKKGKKRFPLIRHGRLKTPWGPFHLFSYPKSSGLGPAHQPTRLGGSISCSWAVALCVELEQLNLGKQLAHDVPSDKSLFVRTSSRGTASHHEWGHSREKTRQGRTLAFVEVLWDIKRSM